MQVDFLPYRLDFRFPFGLSHSKRKHTDNLYIRIRQNGETAFGEAVFPPYLSPSAEESLSQLENISWPSHVQAISQNWLNTYSAHNLPLRAAIEMAAESLKAKLAKQSLGTYYGVDAAKTISTFTVGLGPIEEIKQKLIYSKGFQAIKIKLGPALDKVYIRSILDLTSLPFCVDVNQGWKDTDQAIKYIDWLSAQGCFLVEQPLNKANFKGHLWLKERSPIPIIADESCQTIHDIHNCAVAFDGINIKLMKCGGMNPALNMIKLARKKELKVLIGCMSGSSVAINAAEQLKPLCDWADLDGNVLIKNDPDVDELFCKP